MSKRMIHVRILAYSFFGLLAFAAFKSVNNGQSSMDIPMYEEQTEAKAADKAEKANAQKTVFSETPEMLKAAEKTELSWMERMVAKKVAKKLEEKAADNAEANADGEKSQTIAFVLCWLLGALGIHRFYLGYTWQGIVQLLTVGACGIWTLIDFIRIITGDLKPKGGEYDKKWDM